MALTSDRIHARPLSLPSTPQEFALGPTGKRLVVQSRGQIATLGVEKGESRPIATLVGSTGAKRHLVTGRQMDCVYFRPERRAKYLDRARRWTGRTTP